METIYHTGKQRLWGYEIPATFIDENAKEYNIVMIFPAIPTEQEKIDMATFWINKIEAESIVEEIITEDGTVI